MLTKNNTVNHTSIAVLTIGSTCIALMLISAMLFSALVLTVRPELVINKWEKQPDQINSALALQMLSRLENSIAINPLDANSHLLMARYYKVLIDLSPNKYSELAEHSYRLAIEKQPSWDYAWAQLASFYSLQQVVDESKLIKAITKTILLGPFEEKSQNLIIPLLFKHWSLIGKGDQDKAKQIFKHAVHFGVHRLLTFDSAKKYKQFAILTPVLTAKWHKLLLERYQIEHIDDY